MPTLNVVLHGLFTIVERPNSIVALAPRVGREHVFRAGFWLGETDLHPGTYTLTGVTAGTAKFDPTRNLKIGRVRLSADAEQRAHAVFHLPRPSRVSSLRTVKIDPEADFAGADRARVNVIEAATIQVLTYEYKNRDLVRLGDFPWEPRDTETNNLHIYSEEEIGATALDAHPTRAFAEAVSLFEGLDLQLRTEKLVPELNGANEDLPPGLTLIEIEVLAERRSRLEAFGEGLQTILGDPANACAMLQGIWEGGGLGGDLGSCSFTIGEEG